MRRDQRFKVPMSAKPLLTSNPKVLPLCDFYPDDEWDKFCQRWGQGEEVSLSIGAPRTELLG